MGADLTLTYCAIDSIRQPRAFSGKVYTVWACGSEGERLTGSQKVVGSSPTRSISFPNPPPSLTTAHATPLIQISRNRSGVGQGDSIVMESQFMKYAGPLQNEDGDSVMLHPLKTRGSERTSFWKNQQDCSRLRLASHHLSAEIYFCIMDSGGRSEAMGSA